MQIQPDDSAVTFKMTVNKSEAQAIYAALNFPLWSDQKEEYAEVWDAFAGALDEAFAYTLLDPSDAGMVNSTTIS